MSDIVEKLYDAHVCSPAQNYCRNDAIMQIAANMISELQSENKKLKSAMVDVCGQLDIVEELVYAEAKQDIKTAITTIEKGLGIDG